MTVAASWVYVCLPAENFFRVTYTLAINYEVSFTDRCCHMPRWETEAVCASSAVL